MTTTTVSGPAKPRFRLSRVDMNQKIGAKAYDRKLIQLQHRLRSFQIAYMFSKRSAVPVFEGWDAAGKGGTIHRITHGLDPRSVVWPIAAPQPNDLERHYLARFWEWLPPNGALAIFDRSWYGRILVERVLGWARQTYGSEPT